MTTTTDISFSEVLKVSHGFLDQHEQINFVGRAGFVDSKTMKR
jgi:hypothetical protein